MNSNNVLMNPQDSTQRTFLLNELPFWYSVVGCGQDACFGVTNSSSSKLKKQTQHKNKQNKCVSS